MIIIKTHLKQNPDHDDDHDAECDKYIKILKYMFFTNIHSYN